MTFGTRPPQTLAKRARLVELGRYSQELRDLTAKLRDNSQPLPSLRDLRRANILRLILRAEGQLEA